MDAPNQSDQSSKPSEQPQTAPQQPSEPEAQWQYNPSSNQGGFVSDSAGSTAAEHAALTPGESVEWTAPEFIAHHHGFGWYAGFAGITLVLVLLVYLVTRDRVSVAAILVLVVIVAVGIARPPRDVEYQLDSRGLAVGKKTYTYHQFKAFSLLDEDALTSITLEPLNRFMLPINIYFPPEAEEKIIAVLSSRLPLQPASQDFFDSLMRRVHL
ncbi:MAG TPA: hypothetical protein VLE73_05070 [Candidatus Saccharimonadales bacterium]|nr:hypothetical protein [Candidatus Saccharimonadales bacterium]